MKIIYNRERQVNLERSSQYLSNLGKAERNSRHSVELTPPERWNPKERKILAAVSHFTRDSFTPYFPFTTERRIHRSRPMSDERLSTRSCPRDLCRSTLLSSLEGGGRGSTSEGNRLSQSYRNSLPRAIET